MKKTFLEIHWYCMHLCGFGMTYTGTRTQAYLLNVLYMFENNRNTHLEIKSLSSLV